MLFVELWLLMMVFDGNIEYCSHCSQINNSIKILFPFPLTLNAVGKNISGGSSKLNDKKNLATITNLEM